MSGMSEHANNPNPQPPSENPQLSQSQTSNQTVNISQNVIVADAGAASPNWFVRLVYFVFIGSWLSLLATIAAYLCFVTIVLIPVGIAILNNLPQITTLRPRSKGVSVTTSGGTTTITTNAGAEQIHWIWRTLYFILAGWWVTLVYLVVVWVLVLVTFGWAALFVYNPVPMLLTLQRN